MDLNALLAGAGIFVLCGALLFVAAIAVLIWFLVTQRPMKVSATPPPRPVDTMPGAPMAPAPTAAAPAPTEDDPNA